MIRQSRSVITVISTILFALGLLTVAVPKTWASSAGYVVVANRASGSISIIDVATDTAFDIPLTGVNTPEPMYVVSSPASGRLFVGDRANNQVVVFRTRDFSVEDTVPAGNGPTPSKPTNARQATNALSLATFARPLSIEIPNRKAR